MPPARIELAILTSLRESRSCPFYKCHALPTDGKLGTGKSINKTYHCCLGLAMKMKAMMQTCRQEGHIFPALNKLDKLLIYNYCSSSPLRHHVCRGQSLFYHSAPHHFQQPWC